MPLQQARAPRTRRTSSAGGKVITASSSAPYVPNNHHPPKFITLVGIGFLILWVVALMTQIQTNEAFITNAGQVNAYRPNWQILWQPIALILGELSPQDAIATIFGWGVELI